MSALPVGKKRVAKGAQLQMLYSEWLDQYLDGRIQIKSPPTIFSLASLVLVATIAYCSLVNIATIILSKDK